MSTAPEDRATRLELMLWAAVPVAAAFGVAAGLLLRSAWWDWGVVLAVFALAVLGAMPLLTLEYRAALLETFQSRQRAILQPVDLSDEGKERLLAAIFGLEEAESEDREAVH